MRRNEERKGKEKKRKKTMRRGIEFTQGKGEERENKKQGGMESFFDENKKGR